MNKKESINYILTSVVYSKFPKFDDISKICDISKGRKYGNLCSDNGGNPTWEWNFDELLKAPVDDLFEMIKILLPNEVYKLSLEILNIEKNVKDHIENVLKQEETIKKILTVRTHYPHVMTKIYFFNIFVRVLNEFNIDCIHKTENIAIDDDEAQFCHIDFHYKGEIYTTEYDHYRLIEDIKNFNELQSDMSLRQSSSALIDIFISLLV